MTLSTYSESTPSPPQNWDYYIDRARNSNVLDKKGQKRAVEALRYFQNEPEEDLLGDFQRGEHPIQKLIWTNGTAHFHFLIWLADELQELDRRSVGGRFVSKIEKPNQFFPTVAEIETASRLRRAGCDFEAEPAIEVGDTTKHPDFRVQAGNGFPCSYVEVKYRTPSASSRKAMETIIGLRTPSSPFSGIVFQSLAPVRLKEINERIRSLEREAQESGELEEFEVSNVIRIATAPEEKVEEVEAWAEEQGLDLNGLSGPPEDPNQAGRVKAAIDSKTSQIPADRPGIVAIKNPETFRDEQTVYEALVEIEEKMQRFPHVAFVLIHGLGLNNGTPLIEMRRPASSLAVQYQDHIYAEYFSRRKFMVDQVLVLQNEHCTFIDQFETDMVTKLARSILTGYAPKPIMEIDLKLSEKEFRRRFH
jgi:hypothetical protein